MGDLWLKLADAMETALARKGRVSKGIWSDHTTVLVPLQVGENVLVQNQTGKHPTRWDKRGVVMKAEEHD